MPQGSNLSPPLFVIHIDDLSARISVYKLLYADFLNIFDRNWELVIVGIFKGSLRPCAKNTLFLNIHWLSTNTVAFTDHIIKLILAVKTLGYAIGNIRNFKNASDLKFFFYLIKGWIWCSGFISVVLISNWSSRKCSKQIFKSTVQ